ncbi:hypothetical protein GYMLUDRAFT_163766 [Collybiopsis luxurians FD-317 M1]|uniref:Uncharacterized protein n=1 Tax=Collybiopsis luxurians FD-317 M1 TaxID=944289 RepID=A0A0D0C4M1_9AGAR|nr:hypothetical protein GYMLUDRAFT_163766 [Collybiopsis luxurians FD-317 M1]
MNTLLLLSIVAPGLSFATHEPLRRDTPSQGYFDPSANGGSMLTTVADTSPPGQQEPINMIISANSDSAVLKDTNSEGGLQTYFNSLGFAGECLGNHLGNDQQADLGDGNGLINQTGVMRWDYGDVQTGTCRETVDGGNHFRYWVQNGSSADSNAIFMAASYELPASSNHDIVVNGYNLGRDYITGNITGSTIPTESLSNSSTFSGSTSFNGFNYSTSIQYISGLLPNTSSGINHNLTVATDGQNAVDGLVAVLTVKITATNTSTSSNSSSSSGGGSSSGGSSGALALSMPAMLSLVIAGLLSFYTTL